MELIAAEYRHTTARGVMEGDAPDPQLHSHVVITSAVRDDGRIVAVASRPIFRSAREVGAYYRSALAHELAQRGYRDRARAPASRAATSRSPASHAGCSTRSRRAAARSPGPPSASARSGAGHPSAASCASSKLENRKAKVLVTRGDLQQVWNETAARFDVTTDERAPVAAPDARRRAGRVRLRIASRSA